MTPLDFATDIARSLGFLSRIPVPGSFFEGDTGRMERTSGGFAIAGLAIAALPALLLFAAGHSHAPFLAAALSTGLMVLLTGGLHEDGLGDTADGLGAGKNRERALDIMKDSRIGSYGALALVISLLVRVAALSTLITAGSPAIAALALLASAAASRSAMVWHWRQLSPARPGGVAAGVGQPSLGSRNRALLSGLLIFLFVLLPALSLPAVAAALMAGLLTTYGFTMHVEKRLGGHTGDTIGAMQQISDMVVLAALALLV